MNALAPHPRTQEDNNAQASLTNLFESARDQVPDRLDLLLLPEAVDAAQGLLFHHRVPLRLEEVGYRRRCEIKSALCGQRSTS